MPVVIGNIHGLPSDSRADRPGRSCGPTATSSRSASTSARCPAAPSWSGWPTAPSWAAPCTSTPTASWTTALPAAAVAAAAGLGAAGARGLRRRAAHRRAGGRRGRRDRPRRRSSASRTDFTACTVLPTLADGTPLCELPEYADRPHAYVKLWKHHAAQPQADRINELAARAGRAVAGALRRADLQRSGSSPRALQLLEEDPRALRPRWTAGSRRPTGSSGSCTGRYVRNACTAGYKGIYQDGRYPSADFLAALNPAFAGFVPDKLDHRDRPARRRAPARLTAEAAAWTGLPEGIAVAVGNVDAHVTAPAAQARRARPDGRHHGHLDLPRDERTTSCARCRACAGSSTAASWRAAGATRPARAGSATSSAGSSSTSVPAAYAEAARGRGRLAARAPHPAGRRAGGRRARAGRAGLAQRQPVGAGRPRALRPGRRADAGHQAGGRLPGAARGDGVRHPGDRRDVPRQRGAGRRSSSSPAGWPRTRCSCRSTPT